MLTTKHAADGIEITDKDGNQAGFIRYDTKDGYWRAESWVDRKAFRSLEAAEYWLLALYLERRAALPTQPARSISTLTIKEGK
jgi:hypothetical protein